MGKLISISFTGIDARTDLNELENITKENPFVDFAVLLSRNWKDNGNRYYNPHDIFNFLGKTIFLNAHLCGSLAHDAALGKHLPYDFLDDRLWDRFHRFQLNLAERQDNPPYVLRPFGTYQQIIIQQRSIDNLSLFLESIKYRKDHRYRNFSLLLDASGGRGIDTPIQVYTTKKYHVGYAGGINEENVADKLRFLLSCPDVGPFWIDIESGVRTDDWFDTAKVRRIIEICKNVVKEHRKTKRNI